MRGQQTTHHAHRDQRGRRYRLVRRRSDELQVAWPKTTRCTHGCKITLEKIEGGHVAFASHAVPTQESDWYGASIPLGRAMDIDADVILALEVGQMRY